MFAEEVLQSVPVAVRYVRTSTEVAPVVLIASPSTYAVHEPASILYSKTSVIVPVPPEPGVVSEAETDPPAHTVATFGVLVSVPGVGCATTDQLTMLAEPIEE